jgi:hypothetical protein
LGAVVGAATTPTPPPRARHHVHRRYVHHSY